MRETSYRGYLLSVLMAILAFNYLDRIVLGVVQQDIKLQMHLSDTQLGFLTGMAFAVFYSVMGIPIARWADLGNRIVIIATTTALWSMAVAACAVVGNYTQLMLVRIGVAVGEAGCMPPANSLIADHFSRAERPRAVSRYALGAPLSLTLGYLAGGWLNQLYGWRVTFVIIGLPGVLLALLVLLTLREPRRHGITPASNLEERPSVREVITTLASSATFCHLLLCFSVWYFFGYGLLQWQPSFFIRSHAFTTGELGTWLAVVYGASGLLGIYLGGEWATRYAPNNEGRQLAVTAALMVFFGAFSAAAYLVVNRYLAFGLLGIGSLGGSMLQGPLLAAIQTLVPARMRATALALLYLFANLIGMGLGPLAAGALSDTFRPWAGQESLRYALLMFCPGYAWAAWHAWRASKSFASDLQASSNKRAVSTE